MAQDKITRVVSLENEAQNTEIDKPQPGPDVPPSQGVIRMEAVYRAAQTNRKTLWLTGISVLVCAWAYSLDSSTTSYYSVDASSYFKQHSSVLSTLSIATSIISAVSKPFIYLDRKAKKAGLVNVASSNAAHRAAREHDEKQEHASLSPETKSWIQSVRGILDEIDAFGLVLLGLSWSLLLLPFSLKTYADGGWRNPSLIAMMIVGGLLLIAYVVYEMKWARVPSAPRRLVFNKTFIMSIVIDSIYLRMYPVPPRIL